MMELLAKLKSEFEIMDSETKCYFGLEIELDLKLKSAFIIQHTLAVCYGSLGWTSRIQFRNHRTFIPSCSEMKMKMEICSGKPYCEIIGSFMYLAVGTRPDIAFIATSHGSCQTHRRH